MSATIWWPETEPEDEASFVSDDDGKPGTWTPICSCTPRQRMRRNYTPWTNYICPECGILAMIWAEDFPDAYEDACDECDAWPADVLTNGGENRNAPDTWHEDSCSLHTDNIEKE